MPGLTITEADPSSAGETMLIVGGEIDLTTAPQLQDALDNALDARPSGLAVDLSAVEFLDSTGLRTLITAHERADELGFPLTWVDPAPPVLRLFGLTGVDQRLNVRSSDSR
jgi:anti-sigma B factor antagonist